MSYTGLRGLFAQIANAIRAKTGDSEPIIATDFPQAIANIITIPAGWHDTSEVTATAADVLSQKKIVDANGDVLTGSMVPQSGGTYAANLNEIVTIATAGKYYSGDQTISAITVENLAAEKVKNGEIINVRSGGTIIKTVTGSLKGQVKKLTKTPSAATAVWNKSDSGTLTLPYVEFNTNELGFVPDALICVDSGQVTQQTIWENKSYSGAGLNYFVVSWWGALVRWQNDTVPTGLSSTNYKIPVPSNVNRNFYILAMKE